MTSIAPVDISLAKSFAARQEWYTNRASALFPLRLRIGGDLIICYLNYWSIKNKIENIQRIIRIYNEIGELKGRQSQRVVGQGAAISVAKVFDLKSPFDGMVEIEFIALDNLRFSFPAVQAFYTDGQAISTVHSAGRNKNADESSHQNTVSVETNWICKFSENVTPFFHVFTPGAQDHPVDVEVSVYSPKNKLLASQRLGAILVSAFSSKLVTLDSLFPELCQDAVPPLGSYCQIKVPQTGIFPRLVVGNLHRSSDFLEVTHSFALQNNKDFVTNPEPLTLWSFIPAVKPPDLNLNLYSFPTNSISQVTAQIRHQKLTQPALRETGHTLTWCTGGVDAEVMRYTVPENVSLVSIDLSGHEVPSRLNVSYQFSVCKSKSPYSTDISTGAKSCVYPPKHSHWGTCVVGGSFKTVLMGRNMSHKVSKTQKAKGTLRIWFANDFIEERALIIDAEASAFWTINLQTPMTDNPQFIHWLANFDQPSVEVFWVSYAPDGRICGDHSF